MLLWYPLVAHWLDPTSIGFDLFRPSVLGQLFNSMAEHLLRGRFDVDPAAVDFEVFLVGDRAIAYFGIFCALLRIPLVLVPSLAKLDVTWLSCLLATWIGAWFQLKTVLLARDAVPPGESRDWLCVALCLAILFGGQQIQFLRPSVYQEVIGWAGAEAAVVVWLTARGLLTPIGFSRGTMTAMAVCAGLALLTRVSFGIGLYAAMAWLLLHRRHALPAAVLLGFACAAGIVNQGRWGNPLIFADFTRYSLNLDVYPDRLTRLAEYGAFNVQRLPIGLAYYILPLWALIRPDGHFLWAETQTRLIDAMELPPGALLLSDPLPIALTCVALWRLRDGAKPRLIGGLFAGLALPGLLMLCAISMTYRYRMEFYPFLGLGVALGMGRLCRLRTTPSTAIKVCMIAATLLGIAVSHAQLALYLVSPWGPAEQYILPDGWIGTYAPRLAR